MNEPRHVVAAVLAAGNGGQALAASLALQGCETRLWNRSPDRLEAIRDNKTIVLRGAIECASRLSLVTTNLEDAVRGAHLIFVASTADAHAGIAHALAPFLCDGQIVLLNPGRTGGALEMTAIVSRRRPDVRIFIAEAQSLVYACRIEQPGVVRVIGAKDYVPVAAVPASDTRRVIERVRPLFPMFAPAEHALHTSFENIGSIFHPAVLLFNAAAIERGTKFYFYQDMTPAVAEFLMALDAERLRIGAAYGLSLLSIEDWIRKAYPATRGDNICELMRNNPAYNEIRAPETLDSRLLREDIPTGLVPFVAFARAAGVKAPLMEALVHIGSALLKRDFEAEGRSLRSMGLEGMSPAEILAKVSA
jgi:opine dehydrogenase